jgi:hypothetical protein
LRRRPSSHSLRFFIRLQEAGRVLSADADDVLAFDDLETAR